LTAVCPIDKIVLHPKKEIVMRDVKGKVALITGAARGMGRLLAEKFAQDGAVVVIADVDSSALEQAKRELVESGAAVHAYAFDVSDREQVYRTAEKIKAEVGPVQILVNNAGVIFKGDLLDQPDEKIETTYAVNLLGTVWMTKAYLPGMIETGQGHIVNMASASGLMGLSGGAAYGSSKWAVIGFTESVRYEMMKEKHPITFTIVCPSYVGTGMFEGAKPPKSTTFLNPKNVVDRIYMAVKKDKLWVMTPFMVNTVSPLKALLPQVVFDKMQDLLGLTHGLEGLKK
jgi:all-trans-retinol dehydrogenase (NAD+)